jgi:Ni/Fe-hydrogenase subunit HybB-like protein
MDGFMYPNEVELQWSILIVLYPFVTGLVAGAFILASLERVFMVEAVKPTYRLALLTALAFLLVAPLPLQLHLGHPERSLEMFLTPHTSSAMAMFGFVYLWYLMVVLLLEIWLDYRKDIVLLSQSTRGVQQWIYKALTLGSSNISAASLRIDDRVGYIVTLIGIPSAFLLHGYVGFIFGSVKANPWWSTPLMPIVFLFSAIVSGITLVLLLYVGSMVLRKQSIDMRCLDTIARYLLYIFIVDFALEMLDLIHRIYEADESFQSLDFMVHSRLYFSHIVVQIILGTLIPLTALALTQVVRLGDKTRKVIYTGAATLILIGIFAMRWNVVIGGQLFSKTFLGYTTYKMEFAHREGLLAAIVLMILPFVILWGLLKLLPPWTNPEPALAGAYGESNARGIVVADSADEPRHIRSAEAGVAAGTDDGHGTARGR